MGRVLEPVSQALEFEFTDKDFKFVQWYMHKNVGIYLADSKRNMVYGRISRKLREKGLIRFGDYRTLIEHDERECGEFINALTTNKTSFFREKHHIDFLQNSLVPVWKAENKSALSVWSAGCSTGEEPYSYLAALSNSGILKQLDSFDMLASDLDSDVLAVAQRGIYDRTALDDIPSIYLKGNFLRGMEAQKEKIRVHPRLQQWLTFAQINLLQAWPMKQKFDLISCRNVMIYFDKKTQTTLIERFYQQLNPSGWLFLGHSEGVSNPNLFEHIGQTVYRKVD